MEKCLSIPPKFFVRNVFDFIFLKFIFNKIYILKPEVENKHCCILHCLFPSQIYLMAHL